MNDGKKWKMKNENGENTEPFIKRELNDRTMFSKPSEKMTPRDNQV